jgi:hypothetical protein
VAAPLGFATASGAPAAHSDGIKVVVRGLDAPSEVQFGGGGRIYVASLATGNVVRASGDGGHGHTVFAKAATTGVAPVDASTTYLLAGEGGPKGAKLYRGNPKTGKVTQVANLKHYEKAHNPDGQKQCVGKHCDSISNPFSLLRTTQDILIADAGANDILAYNIANGRLHTFHVFANIQDTKRCKNARNNDPNHPGCDPVPTGLARGPGNTVYVSLLGAESKNAAKVVELDLPTGTEIRRWGHMSSVDGVAVSPTGVVYASELEYGLNPKAPDFDHTGRVVRIQNGVRTYAPVPTPGGLIFHDGRLYASAHLADALFAQIRGAGQVVRVAARAFHK